MMTKKNIYIFIISEVLMYTFFTDLANRCVLTLDSQLTQRCRNDRMTAVIIITIIIVMLVILPGGGGGGGEQQSMRLVKNRVINRMNCQFQWQ